MVQRSHVWDWSSLKPTARSGPDGLLCDGPILKPSQWTRYVKGVENANGQPTGHRESKVIHLQKPFLKRTRHILSTMNGKQNGNPVVSRFVNDNKTVHGKTT